MKRLRDAWPVIVIVATIAGAAWMAAWNVQRFISAEISASEARLAARIAEIRQYIVDHSPPTPNRTEPLRGRR